MCPASITAPLGSSPRADAAAILLADIPAAINIMIGPARAERVLSNTKYTAEVMDARNHKKGRQKVVVQLPCNGGYRGLIIEVPTGSAEVVAREAARRLNASNLPEERIVAEPPAPIRLPAEFHPRSKTTEKPNPPISNQVANGLVSRRHQKQDTGSLSYKQVARAVAKKLNGRPGIDPSMRTMYEAAWMLARRFGRNGTVSDLPGRLARSLGISPDQVKATLNRLVACQLIQPYAISSSVEDRDHLYTVSNPNEAIL